MKEHLNQLVVIAVVLSFLIAGCSSSAASVPPTQPPPTAAPPTQAPTPQSKDPESVLRAITEALNRKDVEAATALLADDVAQTLLPAPSGTGIYKGKEAIRARFKEVVAGNPTHKLTSCQTSGDQVICAATYSDDSTKPLGFDLEFTVDAIVQNGLLKTVTWKMTDASLAKMQAAMANAQPQTISLTFAKDECTFGGPMRVPVGEIAVNIKAEGDAYYGLFIATFDKGKTLDDLNGLPVVPQPDWVHEVDKVEFSTDRTMVTTVRQGPIYLICFNLTGAWTPIGRFGPIEVGEAPKPTATPAADPNVLKLKGIYEKTITKQENSEYAGIWRMIISPSDTGGSMRVAWNGYAVETEPFTVTQDTLVLTKSNEWCPGPGAYKWALDGKALTFTKVADDCRSRSTVMQLHAFIKKD